MMPDLLNYWLTGQKVSECTIASTSQCLDPLPRRLGDGTAGTAGHPHALSSRRSSSRARCWATCCPRWPRRRARGGVQVVAPGCHDTASAVAAVPAESEDYAYLSSGTWSLMGVETPAAGDQRDERWRSTSPTRAASATRSACSRTSPGCGSSRSAGGPGCSEGRSCPGTTSSQLRRGRAGRSPR